jgi:predicted nucleic acid-binding protein
VVIYFLEEVYPYWRLAQHLLGFMERGFITGVASTVVEAEVLVKPLRERDRLGIEKAELFFAQSPNLAVRIFDRPIARRAAQVRASTRLLLPDAIIVATALEERCDAIVGNDAAMAQQVREIPYLYMENYVS